MLATWSVSGIPEDGEHSRRQNKQRDRRQSFYSREILFYWPFRFSLRSQFRAPLKQYPGEICALFDFESVEKEL